MTTVNVQETDESLAQKLKPSGKPKKQTIYKALAVILAIIVICIIVWQVDKVIDHDPAHVKSAYVTLNNEVNKDASEGKNSEVINLDLAFLGKYSKYAKNNQLYFVNDSLANSYQNLNDYQSALTYQLAAISNISPVSYSDYSNLGNIYQQLNDNQQAIKYYQLALNNLSSNPAEEISSDNLSSVISAKISQLEKTN